MNITKIALTLALTLSSASALAQDSSIIDYMKGRVWASHDDNGTQNMLVTFGKQSNGNAIAFNAEHTCGYASGTLTLSKPDFITDIDVKFTKRGRTDNCSEQESNSIKTLETANRLSSLRNIESFFLFSSPETDLDLRFVDVTDSENTQQAQQKLFNTYWLNPNSSVSRFSPEPFSAQHILESAQRNSGDWTSHINHDKAFSVSVHENNFLVQTLDSSIWITDHNNIGVTFEELQTVNSNVIQGTIDLSNLSWGERILSDWAEELRPKNRFQIDENTLTLSSSSSEETTEFKGMVKEANIDDLKNTKWVGTIADQSVTVDFLSHSLNEIAIKIIDFNNKIIFVRLNTDDSKSFKQAQIFGNTGEIIGSELSNTLPDLQSVIVDYSNPTNRKLHIVTKSAIYTLTERTFVPIVFPNNI